MYTFEVGLAGGKDIRIMGDENLGFQTCYNEIFINLIMPSGRIKKFEQEPAIGQFDALFMGYILFPQKRSVIVLVKFSSVITAGGGDVYYRFYSIDIK